MSEVTTCDVKTEVFEKPVLTRDAVMFLPFPDPTVEDFDEDIGEEERNFYKDKFKDLNDIKASKLHCTACDRHLGCSIKNDGRMRAHPLLRTLVCDTCHTFYNSGEFEKGDDGSELYCRWCGQGGQVYCCSDCPHVFCAKCIKRNFGMPKIKEIENTDDWKCFQCHQKPLWDLRALCWALLRYCDLRNKTVHNTQDNELKEKLQKECEIDDSECCKEKRKRISTGSKKRDETRKEETKKEEIKKEETKKDVDLRKSTSSIISKIPPTIQVKKFASIIPDEPSRQEKRGQKRPASPKSKQTLMKNPVSIAPYIKPIFPTPPKKIKVMNSNVASSVLGTTADKNKFVSYTPRIIRPRAPPPLQMLPPFHNGFNNMYMSDNINLSLDSLTQGLDMDAVASMNNKNVNDDVVCTPDFPLEPLCEVMEDNPDDDVQCMTPTLLPRPSVSQSQPPPMLPLPPRQTALPDISPDNIIQMTENDVTVNAATGGLKFRVDPQTLSSNKMYRLPDGRIFAINPNPSMPGGYSATIVALTDNNNSNSSRQLPKNVTYSAKLCAVTSTKPAPTPPTASKSRRSGSRNMSRRIDSKGSKSLSTDNNTSRQCDLEVPVEWYRYNLIDAVDSLEYSLTRLKKLKKEATTAFLRSRTVSEMRHLHHTLERLLNNSAFRFHEVRDNLQKGFKQYLNKKNGKDKSDIDDDGDDDDDDVEILNEVDEPIFIDENSLDSNSASKNDNQEVDLVSSDINDSGEKILEHSFKAVTETTQSTSNNKSGDTLINDDENLKQKPIVSLNSDEILDTDIAKEPIADHFEKNDNLEGVNNNTIEMSMDSDETQNTETVNCEKPINDSLHMVCAKSDSKQSEVEKPNINVQNHGDQEQKESEKKVQSFKLNNERTVDDNSWNKTKETNEKNKNSENEDLLLTNMVENNDENALLKNNVESDPPEKDSKINDTEMSDEMIETLLKEETSEDRNIPKEMSLESGSVTN